MILREKFSSRRAWLPRGARTDGLGVGPERAVFDIHFIFFSGSFVYYLTCVFLNPTSPLGLGGLECGVSFSTLLFSTILVSTLWGEVYLSPYPLSVGRDPPTRDGLGFLVDFRVPWCDPFLIAFAINEQDGNCRESHAYKHILSQKIKPYRVSACSFFQPTISRNQISIFRPRL